MGEGSGEEGSGGRATPVGRGLGERGRGEGGREGRAAAVGTSGHPGPGRRLTSTEMTPHLGFRLAVTDDSHLSLEFF